MRVRERSGGLGPAIRKVSGKNFSGTSEIQVSWSWAQTKNPLNLQPKVVNLWGVNVTFNPPPEVINYQGYHYCNNSDAGWQASCLSIAQNNVTRDTYWSYWLGNDSTSWYAVDADDSKSMIDIVGSGFQSAREEGRRVINPCSRNSLILFCPSAPCGPDQIAISFVKSSNSLTSTHFKIRCIATFSQVLGVASDFSDLLYSQLTSLVPEANLDSMYADTFSSKDDAEMELLSTLAEGKKTLGYIVQRLNTLASILNDVKRGDFSFLGKKGKDLDIASLWLEARYAVRPIVIDVQNAMRALSKDGNLSKIIKTHRHKASESTFTHSFAYNRYGGLSGTVNLEINYSEYASAGLYSQLQFDWPTLQRFGLTNVARTFWEVVPWSFVIDWFVNSAGLISMLNPNPIYKPLSGWTSLRRNFTFQGTLSTTILGASYNIPISGVLETYNRKREQEPVPITFDFNLSIPKFIDLISFGSRR